MLSADAIVCRVTVAPTVDENAAIGRVADKHIIW